MSGSSRTGAGGWIPTTGAGATGSAGGGAGAFSGAPQFKQKWPEGGFFVLQRGQTRSSERAIGSNPGTCGRWMGTGGGTAGAAGATCAAPAPRRFPQS